MRHLQLPAWFWKSIDILLTKSPSTISRHWMVSTLQSTGLLLKRTAPCRISVRGENLRYQPAASLNFHKRHMHFFTFVVLKHCQPAEQAPHGPWGGLKNEVMIVPWRSQASPRNGPLINKRSEFRNGEEGSCMMT